MAHALEEKIISAALGFCTCKATEMYAALKKKPLLKFGIETHGVGYLQWPGVFTVTPGGQQPGHWASADESPG